MRSAHVIRGLAPVRGVVWHGHAWVLALHGWRRDHRDFDAVLAPPGMDAIALDLPGFGSAPPPDAVWGTPDYAGAVAAVLEEMEAHVVVLGHSFGGRVRGCLPRAVQIGLLGLC